VAGAARVQTDTSVSRGATGASTPCELPEGSPPMPPATVEVIPGRPRRRWRARYTWAILAALALGALALNIVPGMGLSMPAPAARHHAAARPAPPPPVHVTVGQRAYACTVVPPQDGQAGSALRDRLITAPPVLFS